MLKHATLVLAGATLLAGCRSAHEPETAWNDDLRAAVNTWSVTSLQHKQIEGAIVRRRTLYGHHFKPSSPDLNERGHRDLSILAAYFAEVGEATVIMPRGSTAPSLYEARLANVRDRLTRAGVDASRIALVDGLPTGEGIPSARAAQIYNEPSAENPYDLHGDREN